MTKAALYIRVSTREQVENYSIEVQKERLEAFCKAKGWDIYNIYIDGGFSGSTLNRPDLQRMIKDLKNIDVVLVYKLDRLSRSQKNTLELIEEHFLKNNVDFVSITETLDTSTPFGKAMIGILSVFAQLERETIAERMRMGHIKRAENGLGSMGGDYDPAGYSRENGFLIIKDDEAIHIRRAFDLYEQYRSITKMQQSLKEEGHSVWRFRRYRDILANTLYIGMVSFAGKLYKGQHQPIITPEQFERVQVLLQRHKGNNAHKAKRSLLSGLLRCQCCNEQFVSYSSSISKKNPKSYYYYVCRARRFPSEYDEKCNNKIWNRSKLESIVISELKNISIKKSKAQKNDKTINYDKLIKDTNKKMERVIDLYTNELINNDLLEKQMSKLNAEKEKLIQNQRSTFENTQIITDEILENIQSDFEDLEFKDKQAIVQTYIKEIHLDGDNVIIDWRF
ncbi:recombinase family protein [Peribacillus simplex]|uniref:recombinase family protein n=1 Tax=Peribacillus simplex TaxID=1478 RepID=UPI00192156CE|nr:recombinase family protein [Peribacillus simplex]MBD8589177.1 recombinase family protein [Peribacillus simplex]